MEFSIRLPLGMHLNHGMIMYMLSKIVFALSVVSAIGLIILTNVSTPTSIGPLGILVFFVLLYIVFLGVISFMIYGVSKVFNLLFLSVGPSSNPGKGLSFKRSYYFSSALAFAPIILIAQQSIGGVGFFDIVLIFIFEFFACIYISKR